MTEQTELLPCPFCGGEPHTMDAYGETWIHCSLCGVGFDAMSRQPLAELAAAWNRRAASDDETLREIYKDELDAIRRALNGYDGSNLVSLAETVMAQRRLLAEALISALERRLPHATAADLAYSIVEDEPAPDDERREVGEFTQRAIEEIADSWMYRATLHAQMACYYCNAVVVWMGDEGDEPHCEHFPDCLHLRARQLQERDDE